ncbi:hypothetical protein HN011_004390 [Eciton burchellii]|nr:hypothetical protein HN011_004390 [Eciton burchellii]
MSISNLEISGTLPVNESVQIQSRSDIAIFQRNAQTGETAKIDIGGKSNIDSTVGAQHGARVAIDTWQICENIVRTKKKQRPLTCDFCRKEFNHTGDFNKHRRTHTGEQPYTCNICQQRFSHVSNLIRHQRIHSGIKPFPCQSCGRNFARKDKLTVHLTANRCNAKVSKEKPSISQSGRI